MSGTNVENIHPPSTARLRGEWISVDRNVDLRGSRAYTIHARNPPWYIPETHFEAPTDSGNMGLFNILGMTLGNKNHLLVGDFNLSEKQESLS